MSTYFHGMTAKAFDAFSRGEFTGKIKDQLISPWVCSDKDGYTYLWPINYFIEEYDDNAEHECIRSALESASIQSAMNSDNAIYAIEFEFDEAQTEIDDSCTNMQHCRRIESELIQRSNVKRIFKAEINPELHLFNLAQIVNNEQFNLYALDKNKQTAIKCIAEMDCEIIHELIREQLSDYSEIKI